MSGATGDSSLSPEAVSLWVTQTVYFSKMKAVNDVGGPVVDKQFQVEIWLQSKMHAESLWRETMEELGDGSRPVDFILAVTGRTLAWATSNW